MAVELDFYKVIVPDDIHSQFNKFNSDIDNYYVIALLGKYDIFDGILDQEYESIGELLSAFDESKLFDEIEDQDIGNIRFHSLIKHFSNYEEELYKGKWKDATESFKKNEVLKNLVEKSHKQQVTVTKVNWK